MGKPAKKTPSSADSGAVKSKKPRFKGLNHFQDVPKGFRSHGSSWILRGLKNQKKQKQVSASK